MIVSKVVFLKVFLVGASLFVGGRLTWALAFGKLKLRSKIRVRAENPVQFWAAVRIEMYWFSFLLLPATFAVLNFPRPLPLWFKIAMIVEGSVLVGGFVVLCVVYRLREKKRDDANFRDQLFRPKTEPIPTVGQSGSD
jgi:hypothetical protein